MIALVAGVALVAGTTAAQRSLSEVPEITEGLIATMMAYEIAERCDTIEPRLLRGIAFLESLYRRALELGFTDAEVRAYVENPEEKARLEAIAWERFAALGGVRGDYATYCAVGEAQIAADTPVGRLLRH
jgi:hypothetical protein